VRNPAIELSKIIASCFDSTGRVAVEGFYDGFVEPSESLRAAAEEGVLLTPEQIEQILGVPPTGGEQGRGIGERRGLRPTLEVNGLFSGYTGHGNKTIIPQSASVKLSVRLVPDQDPRRTLDALVTHVTARVPGGMRLEIVHSEDTGGALRIDPEGRFIRTARAVLAELHGAPATLVWEGGSVPVLGRLVATSGAEPVLVGYSLPSDNFHSPNESFGLDQAERVFTFTAAFLQELGRQ
jgi:acetylornithine deacetylase/succinyl-diaminopimelate desuccinylase-like protein